MKKLFFYAMLILTVVLTGCGKSEEQKIHSMYLNNSTKVAEMETDVMNKHAVNFSEHYYSLVKKVINI